MAAATSLNPVNFDQADASGVVFAVHDRGPVALDQRGENGGLTIVAGGKAPCLNLRLLGALPIVVRGNDIPAGIVEIEGRVLQDTGHAGPRQGRAKDAHDYFFRCAAANNKAGDADMLTSLDMQPCRNIQLLPGARDRAEVVWVPPGSKLRLIIFAVAVRIASLSAKRSHWHLSE